MWVSTRQLGSAGAFRPDLKVGYESHDRAALPRRNLPSQKYIFPEAQRRVIPHFSLYHLQIILLTMPIRKNISFIEIMILMVI